MYYQLIKNIKIIEFVNSTVANAIIKCKTIKCELYITTTQLL